MKNFLLGLIVGLLVAPTCAFISFMYDIAIYKYQHKMHTPKFKVGDCIRSYGSFDGVIQEFMDENNYGVLIGLECPPEKWWRCSRSAYDILVTDADSVLIQCPKWETK